ncbi:MAG: hypothetical protein QM790_03845 [Nibricoccus sp.]
MKRLRQILCIPVAGVNVAASAGNIAERAMKRAFLFRIVQQSSFQPRITENGFQDLCVERLPNAGAYFVILAASASSWLTS